VGQKLPAPPAVASPGEAGDKHHRFPQQFRDWFSEPPRNIDIDQYLRPLLPTEHTGAGGIHPEGYNSAWKEWIEYNRGASAAECREKLRELETQFGVPPVN